jgi:hypothetical protein
MEVVALIRRVCLYVSEQQESDRFIEQRINTKFYVKVVNNASDTCAVLSEAYGGEAMRKASVMSGINCTKRVARTWKMMKEVVV